MANTKHHPKLDVRTACLIFKLRLMAKTKPSHPNWMLLTEVPQHITSHMGHKQSYTLGSVLFELMVMCCPNFREREMFYLTTHSTHFIYSYMASDIWLWTTRIVREETHCRHMGYSFQITARVLLYAPSHRRDNTYYSLCYTSRGEIPNFRDELS